MTNRFIKPAAALAALAAAATLAPATASAQSYGYGSGYSNNSYSQPYQGNGYNQGYNNGYGYDRCQTYSQGRTGAGALIGGGIGAVAGSQVAGRGNRTGASIIGGVLGAVIGAQVGRASNDNCRSGYQGQTHSQASTYYSQNDRYEDRAYSSGYYDDRGYRANDRYDNRGYSNDRRYDRRNGGQSQQGYQVSADGYYYFDPRRGWLPR